MVALVGVDGALGDAPLVHFVANALGRIIDRAIQVHGALGYSTDTPLAMMSQQARWARFADGADEVHQWRIAQRTIDAYKLVGAAYVAAGSVTNEPAALPPFADLQIDPATLWS